MSNLSKSHTFLYYTTKNARRQSIKKAGTFFFQKHILLEKKIFSFFLISIFKQEDSLMQIDRAALDKLLAMNDRQLKSIIQRLANESGIDPSQFNIDPASIESIRSALRSATDEDLKQVAEQYEANRRKRG